MRLFIAISIAAAIVCAFPSHQVHMAIGSQYNHNWHHPKASDKRSPCPALNTLANHGYLNRNGRNITARELVDAMTHVFNLSPTIGSLLANAAIKGLNVTALDLDKLQKHGFIEHDASLVHNDTYMGNNWRVVPALVDQLIAGRSQLTIGDLRAARLKREQQSSQKNPMFKFGMKEKLTAYAEAALLWETMHSGEYVSAERLQSFLGEERLPDGYRPPRERISFFRLVRSIWRLWQ